MKYWYYKSCYKDLYTIRSKQRLQFATPYILKSELTFLMSSRHSKSLPSISKYVAKFLYLKLHARLDMLTRKKYIVMEPGWPGLNS